MEMMDLIEIKRNPNCKNFTVRKNLDGYWNIYFFIDNEQHLFKTKRGDMKIFKTINHVMSFLEKTNKCNDVRVFLV